MIENELKGRIHSFQSLGTVDGPGIRFVVFLQGCNLRCGCCHNPDTWNISEGSIYTPKQIVDKAVRFKEYFGKDGGLTISGGEPLLQPEFAYEIFNLCHNEGINTCLDTSGSIFNNNVEKLISVTDRVLLDIKYTSEALYSEYVGCSYSYVLEFLKYLCNKNIPVTLRQVIIPTLNDNAENILKLSELAKSHPCVDKVELLPFRKVCQVKYDNMNIPFRFKDIPQPDESKMTELRQLLNGKI